MSIFASTIVASGVWRWILRLGAPGLILVGLIDNSVIPIPGGMDVFLILLTAHRRSWWIVYALTATAAAMLGGYVTYRLAKKGGKESLERKIGPSRARKVYRRFAKGAFSTVLVAAMIPPPFPLVPVLMAAGILQYSPRKFLTALGIGRGVRFFAIAFLGRVYGTAILGWLSRYYRPFLYTLIAVGVVGGAAAILYFKRHKPKRRNAAPVR
jgi:membrane protein YqaA with SNARE-associated domain